MPIVPEWLLIDGSSLIFRAFFGVPATFKAPDGRSVNAVRGFIDRLAQLITERGPRRLLVATDVDWRPQFRVDLIPSYKSHRTAEPIPPGLIPQMPVIDEVMAAAGIPMVGAPGFEAEDIIATVAARAAGAIEIASGDRDLFALVRDPDIRVLYPEGKGVVSVVDEGAITRRYGIPGRAYGDYAVLRGDPSDGLPGLPGVGDKTAASLVKRYGSVEGMLAQGHLSEADADYLRRALQVVRPAEDVPIGVPDAFLPTHPADAEGLAGLAARHGVESSVRRLGHSLGWFR